jgi:hypothetical protein
VLPARIGNTAVTIVDAAPPHRAALIDSMLHLQGGATHDGASLAGA